MIYLILELRTTRTTNNILLNLDLDNKIERNTNYYNNYYNNYDNEKEEDVVDILMIEMEEKIGNGIKCMEKCKWLTIVICCLFISLLSWEIVGDKKGWDGSYWIPLIGVGIMITLW